MAERNKIKVLLIEDNPGDARLIQEMIQEFELLSINMEIAGTLEEAKKKGKEKNFQVILLDMNLPDAYGIPLLKNVDQSFHHTPILILTGLKDQELAMNAVKEGAQDYFYKNTLNPQLLERSIRYAIDRSNFYKQKIEAEAAKREKEKLEEINRKLNETLEELRKSNERLEEYAYVATHNMRGPVVNLKELVGLFDQGREEDENNKEVFERIEYTVNLLYATLHELIDIVALGTTIMDTQKEIRFEEVLENAKSVLSYDIETKNAKIISEFNVESIVYPPNYLNSIVLNLLSNAIKFNKPGEPPEVKVVTRKVDNFICLSIKDNGIGIDMKKYGKKLFRMFQRLGTDNREGRGLGLYLVKTQVESLGGMVSVHSKPGKGTTFSVYLVNKPE